MSSDWDEFVLSDAIEIIGGGTPKTSIDEYWNGDIPWLSVVDFNDSGRFVFDTEKSITEYGLNNSSTKILDEGDIIISARGTVGALAQLGKPMAFNQSCYGIRGKKDHTVNDFLYYLLVNTVNNLKRIAHGGVFDTITRSTFDNISVRIPKIAKQNQIASILGSLDKKIHLNQQTNETLEVMAQAIFKSWFVDFNPVRAKIKAKSAGRDPNRAAMAAIAGISLVQDWDEIETILDHKLARMPEVQQKKLTHTANLFPVELVESDIGEVPKGWGVNRIDELGEIVTGKTPPTKNPENYGSDVPFLTIPDMHGNIFAIKISKYLSKKGAGTQKNKYLPAGSVSMSCIASPGLVVLNHRECHTNQQINTLIPRDIENENFYFFLLRELSDEVIMKGAGGSVFKNLNKGQFSALKVQIPSSNIKKSFNKVVKPLMNMILQNELESQNLDQLRDTLLSKLILGKIRV